MQNVTRVCDYYVTAECIQQYSKDLCTADLISKLLSPPAAADGTWQPQIIAGVVAGGACSSIHRYAGAEAPTMGSCACRSLLQPVPAGCAVPVLLVVMACLQIFHCVRRSFQIFHCVTSGAQVVCAALFAGVVGFLAVCSLVWFLLWKHRKWWASGNGHSGKGSDDEQPDP